jgi:hypothetical protein
MYSLFRSRLLLLRSPSAFAFNFYFDSELPTRIAGVLRLHTRERFCSRTEPGETLDCQPTYHDSQNFEIEVERERGIWKWNRNANAE